MEFDKTGQTILKVYYSDCEVGRDKRESVIVITYNEYTLSSNDDPRFE